MFVSFKKDWIQQWLERPQVKVALVRKSKLAGRIGTQERQLQGRCFSRVTLHHATYALSYVDDIYRDRLWLSRQFSEGTRIFR